MPYIIRTTDPRRRHVWQRIFSKETLPVTERKPHFVFDPEGRQLPVYNLDLSQVLPAQLDRLAAWRSRRDGRDYNIVRAEMSKYVLIAAADCELVDDSSTEVLVLVG